MSNAALTWAFAQPITPAGRKFVLVALADRADEQHACFPGQQRLADDTGQSVEAVRRHLATLERDGYLTRVQRRDKAGHRTSDRYVLAVHVTIPTGQNTRQEIRPVGEPQPAETSTPTGQNDRLPTGQSEGVTQRPQPKEQPTAAAPRARTTTTSPPDPRTAAAALHAAKNTPALRDLRTALHHAGITANWSRLTIDQLDLIAHLEATHGAPTLVAAARRHHRPDNPAAWMQALLPVWLDLPDPVRPDTTRRCPHHPDSVLPCGECAADAEAAEQARSSGAARRAREQIRARRVPTPTGG